jgi:aryl-alcohol dehydrogenase-like predicted oxidoreductase
MLPHRTLGRTDLEISPVGLGSWAVAGSAWAYGWGPQDERDSIAAIRRAVELGVSWIDTAAAYGHGSSEQLVARALAGLPAADRPLVFTKCGLRWNPAANTFDRVLSPETIRAECEASLRRLGIERIDLYQLHFPDESGTAPEETWAVMAELIAEGKVRAAGASNHPAALLARLEAVRHVDAVQPPLSLINRGALDDPLPWAQAHGAGAIVYSPMASGLLSGGFDRARRAALPDDDWRTVDPDFNEPRLTANLALADALTPIAERHGISPGAVAIAWTLACPGVTGAIAGARSAAQVDGWIAAAGVALTDEDLAELSAAIAASGAGATPRPARKQAVERAST